MTRRRTQTTLTPQVLHSAPELAPLALLAAAAELAIAALGAAYPSLAKRRSADAIPIETLATRVTDRADALLDALLAYRTLVDQHLALERGAAEDDLPF